MAEDKITMYGDGIHNDTKALQAWADGESVFWENGEPVGNAIDGKSFKISSVDFSRKTGWSFTNNLVDGRVTPSDDNA